MKLKIALAAFAISLATGLSQTTPTIFVAPLDGDLSQIQGWQPALGEGLAEMLITELTKLNKFQVLESTAIEDLKDEIRMGEEGFVAQDEKVEKGGFAGADFMFRGKVTRFGSKSQGGNVGGLFKRGLGGLGLNVAQNDVRIDWRIVDAYNRKVITSGEAVGTQNGLSFNLGALTTSGGGGIGYHNQEFMNSALGKATVKAIGLIMTDVAKVSLPVSGRQQAKDKNIQKQQESAKSVETALKAMPGKVLAVPSKGILIVSLGTEQGFKAGDKLKLFETIDTKDEKGEVVFSEEKPAGEVTLDSVQAQRSKATYQGSGDPKPGWVVKAN